MAYQGVMDDIRACVELRKPRRIPVFSMSEEFDVKWYGRYNYDEVVQSADKLVEVWSAAVREFDYDWAWLQMDDCIEFEVLGGGCYGPGRSTPLAAAQAGGGAEAAASPLCERIACPLPAPRHRSDLERHLD